MTLKEILRVCMQCKRVAQGGTEDWRAPLEADTRHPAQSHGYCNECFEKLYGPLDNEEENK